MLRALGIAKAHRYHMNEGHSSLLALELLVEAARSAGRTTIEADDIEAVRAQCIFTTHTPVAAAHDQFPMDLVGRVLREDHGFFNVHGVFCTRVLNRILQKTDESSDASNVFQASQTLNLTYLALNLSRHVNGVAKRHAEVSRRIFPKYQIDEITNGVHAATWVSAPIRAVLDRHIPGWQADNFSLRYAHNLPPEELWAAHAQAKQDLLQRVERDTGVRLDPAVLTLGVARRFTAYKRADLILSQPERLKSVAARTGRLQLIFSGKAHPNDQGGKEIIQHVWRIRDRLAPEVAIVYLVNYDLELAHLLTAGADIWLNTPLPPWEASGTSGMKAALNGVPSLSILDGWWLEGCIENVTGWAIGERPSDTDLETDRTPRDAEALFAKLESVAPCYYTRRDHFVTMMRHAIALNGSFFNTQRMIQQYAAKSYL
jgi:starch phosphorylase